MIIKALEIRDKCTFIPILAIQMTAANEAQRYLLRRAGYDLIPSTVLLVQIASGEGRAYCDPHSWGGRTYPVAHNYITEHFAKLADGDVVDVEFILGETSAPKLSERITHP